MAAARKVIITCAVTGSIHTPTMTPYLPITPDEIAQASIGAAEAGAAIIHLHARDPKDGRPTPDPDVFMQFLPRIKQNCDAVLNITTGGGAGHDAGRSGWRRRCAPSRRWPPQHGLDEFRPLSHARASTRNWKYDWEPKHLEKLARLHLPQHLQGDRAPDEGAGRGLRHALRVRMLRYRPSLHAGAFSRPQASSSRRCSCRPSSASSAASAPIRRTCRI